MLKMVIVVNDDVEMSCGKMAVQVAHASVDCAFKLYKKNSALLKKWIREGQKKVVLKADEQEIFKIEEKAKSMGILFSIIKDAGLTELEPGTLTAIAMIGEEKEIDKITGYLPLK